MEKQSDSTILQATVDMRLDACRMMSRAQEKVTNPDTELYGRGRTLHTDAEKIASKYRRIF